MNDIEFQNEFYITMKMIEIQNARIMEKVDEFNTYKQAYIQLTDGAEVEPIMLRAKIQSLFLNADDTSIVNAEPFVDSFVKGTQEQPIHHEENEILKHKEQVYKCILEHDDHGEDDREPDKFKAGYVVYHTKDINNPKPYVQPEGVHDSYMKDECVLWTDGKVHVSKVDNNVYSPSDYPDNWYIANV